jgi:hypothetical protein
LQFDVVADSVGSRIALSRIGAQIGIFHYMLEDFDLGLDALRNVVKETQGWTNENNGFIQLDFESDRSNLSGAMWHQVSSQCI